MKKKRKLSFQLFITTFIVMTVIIAVIMIFQYVFFDVLYENYKTNKMHSEINKLAEKIQNDELGVTELKNIQDEFLFNHNTFVSVMNESGNDYANDLMSKQRWYTVTGKTAEDEEIVFTIGEYEWYYGMQTVYEINSVKDIVAVGDELSILYDVIDGNKVKVVLIAEDLEFAVDGFIPANYSAITVVDVRDATQTEIDEYSFYEYYFSQAIAEDIVLVDEVMMYDNTNTINFEKDVYNTSGELVKIYVAVSLENVEDAAAALLSYYPYFLALAMLCALIVSFIYSNKVSKPIINISRISNKMANLEFDNKVKDNRNNEIGELGDNLNILADNLQNALAELKDANAHLLKDIEQKKEQEKARKQFVDNVSHELKTPLGIIRCYAESLKDNMLTKPQNEYYNDILQEVEKMTRLVMEMLELSKVESGDLKLNKSPVNIKDIIDDNVILHQLSADDKDMKILVQGQFPEVLADAAKIDSAISNIIKNSVEYGEKSTNIIIDGKTKGGICRVSVSNKCKGISQIESEKFFNRFYVGDKSRSEGSTGLGLSICAGIFKAHEFEFGILSDCDAVTVWFEYAPDNICTVCKYKDNENV